MIYLEKKSISKLPTTTGSIIDSTNISDKTKNTYSAKVIDEKVAEAGSISDVTVNGTSVVSDKVAKITLSTVATSGSYNDLTNKPTIPSVGAITTQVKSYSSGDMTANNTSNGTISFTATGPGTGWYPTGVTINSNTTIVLVNGVSLRGSGIAMTSAGNNTCSGSIYFQGNGGGNCRGTTTYYVTWAKLG